MNIRKIEIKNTKGLNYTSRLIYEKKGYSFPGKTYQSNPQFSNSIQKIAASQKFGYLIYAIDTTIFYIPYSEMNIFFQNLNQTAREARKYCKIAFKIDSLVINADITFLCLSPCERYLAVGLENTLYIYKTVDLLNGKTEPVRKFSESNYKLVYCQWKNQYENQMILSDQILTQDSNNTLILNNIDQDNQIFLNHEIACACYQEGCTFSILSIEKQSNKLIVIDSDSGETQSQYSLQFLTQSYYPYTISNSGKKYMLIGGKKFLHTQNDGSVLQSNNPEAFMQFIYIFYIESNQDIVHSGYLEFSENELNFDLGQQSIQENLFVFKQLVGQSWLVTNSCSSNIYLLIEDNATNSQVPFLLLCPSSKLNQIQMNPNKNPWDTQLRGLELFFVDLNDDNSNNQQESSNFIIRNQ